MGQNYIQIQQLGLGLVPVAALGLGGVVRQAAIPVFALLRVHQHGVQGAQGGHQHRLLLHLLGRKGLIEVPQGPVVPHTHVLSGLPNQQGMDALLCPALPVQGQGLHGVALALLKSAPMVEQPIAPAAAKGFLRPAAEGFQQQGANPPHSVVALQNIAHALRLAQQPGAGIVPGDILRHGRGESIHQAHFRQEGLHLPAPMADNLLVQVGDKGPAHLCLQGGAVLGPLLHPADGQPQGHAVPLGQLQPLLLPLGRQVQPSLGAELRHLLGIHPQLRLGDYQYPGLQRQYGKPGGQLGPAYHHQPEARPGLGQNFPLHLLILDAVEVIQHGIARLAARFQLRQHLPRGILAVNPHSLPPGEHLLYGAGFPKARGPIEIYIGPGLRPPAQLFHRPPGKLPLIAHISPPFPGISKYFLILHPCPAPVNQQTPHAFP